MIAGARIGDAEANRHAVEESDSRRYRRFAGKIIAHEKNQFILTGFQFRRSQELLSPAIGIGPNRLEQRAIRAGQRPKLDLHVLGGTTVRGVENVRAEFGSHNQASWRIKSRSRSLAILKISSSAVWISCGREFSKRRA